MIDESKIKRINTHIEQRRFDLIKESYYRKYNLLLKTKKSRIHLLKNFTLDELEKSKNKQANIKSMINELHREVYYDSRFINN